MSGVTSGVKYIKINRLNASGEDYGPQIQAANNIRINYSDIGPVQYDILTTQQSVDYYLLGVIPQPITSSINNIKDFKVSLARSPAGKTLNNTEGVVWISGDGGGLFVASGNNGGYYNDTTDIYTLNLPNIPTFITSSVTVGAVIGTPIYLSVLIPTSSLTAWNEYPLTAPGVQVLNSMLITGNGTFTASSSFNNKLEGKYYFGGVIFALAGSPEITISAAFETISQTTPSASFSSCFINISPDTLNFLNSDENALYNNATIPKYSNIYQDIDYSTGLIPTNFELLVNGNADAAPVQDSNYTATGWSNSRYNGSRVSSLDFNI
jgi:hypothetical protein